jgi:hypothetical protein
MRNQNGDSRAFFSRLFFLVTQSSLRVLGTCISVVKTRGLNIRAARKNGMPKMWYEAFVGSTPSLANSDRPGKSRMKFLGFVKWGRFGDRAQTGSGVIGLQPYQFRALPRVRALFYGMVLIQVLGTTVGATDGATKYLDASGDVRRVADFYAAISEADPSICEPILASLNKEYRVSGKKLSEDSRVSWTSDSLLQSDLQVPWKRELVDQPDAQSYKTTTLDVAQAHLGNRKITLLRRGIEKFSVEKGALSIDRLWTSTGPAPAFSSERVTAKALARMVSGAEIQVDVAEPARPKASVTSGNRAVFPGTLLNVVSVKDSLYVLAVDAAQAEIFAPRSVSGAIDLFVLQLLPTNKLRTVCKLRST